MYYVGNVSNTALHTGYALSHFLTELCRLNPNFLKISPYSLLLSLIPVGYLGFAEAAAHDAQSQKLHFVHQTQEDLEEAEAIVVRYEKLGFFKRFCRLSKVQQACLVGHFGSYFFQDMQTGFFYGQKADIEHTLDAPEIFFFYFGIVCYAIMANFQEIPNTLVSFEKKNDPSVEYFSGDKNAGEAGEGRCSWHRTGFWIGNFLNTSIYASYAIAHFFTVLCHLKSDFYGVSRWAALMSFFPILFFSYSEARAHDAQAKELECANSQPISAGFLIRLKDLSWEQRACVAGHLLSDVFQDLQPLVFIGQLAGMDNLNPVDLLITYALMVIYGLLANAMEALNTLTSFEGENAFIFAKKLASATPPRLIEVAVAIEDEGIQDKEQKDGGMVVPQAVNPGSASSVSPSV
jgi:hypothetical protein